MKTPAEIIRDFDPRGHVGDPLSDRYAVTEEDPSVREARRKRKERWDNSVEKYHRHRPSDEFATKEERTRWGCRLSVAPQGYSGRESGTCSVLRSIRDDRRLMGEERRHKRAEAYWNEFRAYFEREVLPRLSALFSGDDPDGGYDFTEVPPDFIDRHQAAQLAEYTKRRMWVRENPAVRTVVERILWHVIKYGDYASDPKTAYSTRIVKSRIVEAYHHVFGRDTDAGWISVWAARTARGEIKQAVMRVVDGEFVYEWGNPRKREGKG